VHLLAISPGEGFDPGRWEPVLAAGLDGLMLREPGLSARALLDLARWVRARAPGLELWVNGRLDVALAAGCGLHAPEAYPEVPSGLLPLSRPLHDETQWPSRAQAEQLLVSPIFSSPGKGVPWGAARLHRFLDGLPAGGPGLLALGGVEPQNAISLQHPRLAGLAAIRPFWTGAPEGAVARFRGQ